MVLMAVFDSKAGAFMNPWPSQTKGTAIRAFAGTTPDISSELCKHPEDFSLVYLGEFDTITGKVDAVDVPENLGTLASFQGVRDDS